MNSRSFPFAAGSLAMAGIALAGVAFAVLPGTAYAETLDKDPLMARVNGVEVRQSDLQIAREDLGRSIPEDFDEAKTREYLIKYMADLIVMSDLGEKEKVGNEADLRRRMDFARKKTLRDNLLAKTATGAVTETAVRAAFDEAMRHYSADTQLHLRSMVFKFDVGADEAAVRAAEEKARAALERVKKGENFATVTRETADGFSGKMGGDLGFMGRPQMGKEYADVAYTLKDGEVSSLIKTSFGWHIIKVEGRREPPKVEFDAVRDRFADFVSRQAQIALLDKLHAGMKIERLDKAPNSAEAGSKTTNSADSKTSADTKAPNSADAASKQKTKAN